MLLARHPETVGCMQVGIVHALDRFRQWWATGEKKEESRYLNSVVRFDAGAEGSDAGGPPQFVGLFEPEDLLRFCRDTADAAYARAVALKPAASIVIDKTPENIRHADFIARVFPDAYVLHVIRDPRSVVSSQRHGAEDFGGRWPTDTAGGGRYWRNDLLMGRRLQELGDRYREVRYEALLANGVEELERLVEWLGLPSDPAWCRAAVEASSMKEMKKGVKGTPKNFFRQGSATSWREDLSARELRVLEYINRDLMAELGYAPAVSPSPGAPLSLRLTDARRRAIDLARSVRRRLRRLF